jgi:putative tricarboxylic transport membrane protein
MAMKKTGIGTAGAEVTRAQFLKGLGAFGVAASAGGLLVGCGGGETGGGGDGGDYPQKPITIIVPFGPGSGTDFTARSLAETLQKENLIDVPIQVENRPGGGGAVAISQFVNQLKGDAYTIGIQAIPLIIETQLRGDSEYGIDDVTPLARVVTEYDILVVRPDSPYKTAQDLIDDLSQDPGSVAVGGTAGSAIAYPAFVDTIGGDPGKIRYIQYEAGSEIVTAVLNGDLDVGVASISEFAGQLEAGDMRGLAVLGEEPVGGAAEGVPNMKELGYDYPPVENSRIFFGPQDMPQEAVTYWKGTIEKAVQTDHWQGITEKIKWQNTYLTGEEFQRFIDEAREATRIALQETGQLAQ